MAGGRPTLYEPEYVDKVVEFCGQGYSLTAFAGEIRVARSTITEWCTQHAEFSAAVSCAKAMRARWWEDRAREIALNGGPGGQATMVIFGLKNHAAEDFAETVKQEHIVRTQGMTVEERHERSRRLMDAVFDEVVTTQKPGAPNADR